MSEEEQISTEEERVPVPGIDYVVAQDDLETIGVDQLLEGVVSVECFDVNRRLTTLDGELPEEQLSATRLRTHNQNMTVAARAMAERNTFGHLS